MTIDDIKTNGKVFSQSQTEDDFEGFDDEMLFPLFNGQYWIQKAYKYWYHYSYMQRVTIYLFNNSYYLTVDGQDQFVEVEQIADVIERTIVSDFRGWKRDALFEMDNGEIWKQDSSDYNYNYSYRPKAIIYKSGFGYKMLVEGDTVEVKKLK